MEQRVSTSEACCCVRLEIQFIVVLYFLQAGFIIFANSFSFLWSGQLQSSSSSLLCANAEMLATASNRNNFLNFIVT